MHLIAKVIQCINFDRTIKLIEVDINRQFIYFYVVKWYLHLNLFRSIFSKIKSFSIVTSIMGDV